MCMTSEDMRMAAHHPGAQTERRGGAGPAGSLLGGKDPTGRFPSCDQSSLRIVPIPRVLVNSELLLLPNSSRKKDSSASFLLSPLTSMVMVLLVSPGRKVSAPDFAI